MNNIARRLDKMLRTELNGADMVIAVVSVIVILIVLAAETKYWHDCRSKYDRAVCYVGR